MKADITTNYFDQNSVYKRRGLLVFQINNFEFGVELKNVREVIKFTDAEYSTRKRLTSEIISEEGSYTLVNIHGILEFPNVNYGSDSRLILIEAFSKQFGFIVDRVLEIIAVDKLLNDNNLDYIIPHKGNQRFSGVLRFHNRRIIILNLEKITREFYKVIEFPRKIITYEHIDAEIRKKLQRAMGLGQA